MPPSRQNWNYLMHLTWKKVRTVQMYGTWKIAFIHIYQIWNTHNKGLNHYFNVLKSLEFEYYKEFIHEMF